LEIDTATKLVGIIGNPLKQSLSPLMHNLTFQKMGLNYVYLPFSVEADQLSEVLTAVKVLKITGLNVTIPFKQSIIPFLDELSDQAKACGAVNVVKNSNGRLTGYNTDGQGFIASLAEQGLTVKGQALFIGAGGAARAVSSALAANGVTHIDFLDINESQAVEMAQWLQLHQCSSNGYAMTADRFAELSGQADFIINASPIGMYPYIDAAPVNGFKNVKPGCAICDLIYNPPITRFLSLGGQSGLKIVNGLAMFVHQGALSLEIWTGLKPPLDFMKEVAANGLKRERFHSA
jgi:shikimate dehydrogenase